MKLFYISDGDIIVYNNSDTDEDFFYFYKCDVCSFEPIFGDQFKHHRKWQQISKSKRTADMEANTSSGKRNFTVMAKNEE